MKILNTAIFVSIFLTGIFAGQRSNHDSSYKKEKTVESKVDSLMTKMTLREKIGQMVQVDIGAVKNHPEYIAEYSLGSLLIGGDSEIKNITASGWADLYDTLQSYALHSRLKIPIIFGTDAVHGHNNVLNAVIFPHNNSMGCTGDPKLAEEEGCVTAEEMAGTGMDWDFAPCVAVARNIKWGRSEESYGEIPEIAESMGAAFIKGLQDFKDPDGNSLIACAKHYVGDGGTLNGVNAGNTVCNELTLRKIHLPGYIAAVKAGVKSVMISYSSWNGIKMHENRYLITDVLKGELGFKGICITDWAAIDELGNDYKKDIEKSVNAGIDMVMIPKGPGYKNNFVEFINDLSELAEEGIVPISRINDAVRRILTVKFEINIFAHPYTDRKFTDQVGSQEHRQIARQCVRQSLVMLKNSGNILPFSKHIGQLAVAGKSADNLGYQCGGWTISWQGGSGNITKGTTILQAVKQAVSASTKVTFSEDGTGITNADAAVVVVGEKPYAESNGDRRDLHLDSEDMAVIQRIKDKGIPMVVILISGRPMIINTALKESKAFIYAGLPGSEGEGVADVLFGDYNPSGKLTQSWPRSMKQIPVNFGDKNYNPLFPYGYGLSY